MADWPLTAPDGAYELGGGDFAYGQNMTEALARSLFQIPDFDALNALTILPELLLRLPLEALQRFQSFIPDVLDGAFNTVTGAVDAIMSALTNAPRILQAIIDQLNAVLSDIFGGLDLGDLPTPEEFWQLIVDNMIDPLLDFLGPNSPLNAKNLFGLIPRWLIGPLSAASLTASKVNLLANGEFEGAVSLDGGGVWTWDAVSGRTSPGSAWTTAGALRVLTSNPIGVTAGQKIVGEDGTSDPAVWYQTTGYAGTGTPIRFQVREYLDGAAVSDQVLDQAAGSDGTWAQLTGAYTVPDGVDQIRFRLVVDETMTTGSVGFDDGDAWLAGAGPFDGVLKMFNLDSLDDLFNLDPSQWGDVITALMNPLEVLEDALARVNLEDTVDQLLSSLGLDALGSFGDKLLDLFDGMSDLQGTADDALSGLAGKLGLDDWDDHLAALLSNPASVLGEIPKTLVDGLQDAFTDLQDIFDGLVPDPLTSLGTKVGDWFSRFFTGGTQSVVTQDRIAEASGIPPLDSGQIVPWTYLPDELTATALGMQWVQVAKTGSNQPISASTDTLLTGWSQSGPVTLTISGNKFKMPWNGMWALEVGVKWSSSPLTGSLSINLKQNDVLLRDDLSYGTGANKIFLPIPAATTDEFSVYALTAVGSMSVLTAGTFIRATFLGNTTVPSLPPPPDPVTFDASGGSGQHGHDDNQSWAHTFGANANTIVVDISHEQVVSSVTVTHGATVYTIPILSGPTLVGAYFGFSARHTMAAAILPTSVRGATVTVEVVYSASVASSANSMSFNGVGSLGEVITAGGSSGPAKLHIAANVSSMIAVGFGGVNTNFGTLTGGTQVSNYGFVEFDTWAHQIGYGLGGATLQSTSGRWSAKGIELHP